MDSGFVVMDGAGRDPKYAAGRKGWTAINCASKRAYGCGDIGNSAVQDLDLLLHHGDLENLSSSLSVRAGDQFFRWIDQLIAAKGARRPSDRGLRSKVEVVDKGLIVVSLSYSLYAGFDYYLVFDSVDSSLSMIPYIPHSWATYNTKRPLPLRHDGGGGGGYTLVLFGGEFGFARERPNKFLWRWSPTAASSDAWQSNKLIFPSEINNKLFSPDLLFSCNGCAFWTDLALGTLKCDCSTLLSDCRVVKFDFISLPPGCQLERDEDTWPVQVYRTMGYAGGSVKFVAIDDPDDPCDGSCVSSMKVWTLAPSGRKWKLCSDFQLKKLWKDFKRAGLPKNLPIWPMLREQEGDTLYFILEEETQTRDGGQKHHLCRLDMSTKSHLQSKLLAHASLIQGPVMLPSGFLKCLEPLPSSPEPILMDV